MRVHTAAIIYYIVKMIDAFETPQIIYGSRLEQCVPLFPNVNFSSFDYQSTKVLLTSAFSFYCRVTLVSFCLMELHFYPFDIQNCTFEISTSKTLSFPSTNVVNESPSLVLRKGISNKTTETYYNNNDCK